MVNSRNETPSLLRVRDAKLCIVVMFGIFFVVEIEQKQAIWCLKCKSLNFLFKKSTGLCNRADLWRKNGTLRVMLIYYMK